MKFPYGELPQDFDLEAIKVDTSDSLCQLIFTLVRWKLDEYCLYSSSSLCEVLKMGGGFDSMQSVVDFMLLLNEAVDPGGVDSIKKDLRLPTRDAQVISRDGVRITIEKW